MKKRKILISIILSALLILVSFTPLIGRSLPGENSPELIIEVFSGTTPIIKAIQNAKESIYLEIYGFTHFGIAEELGNAELRGVDVKVMMEKSPVGADSENWDVKTKLMHYGIPVKWANPEYFLTHAKFMVIDGKEAMVLTGNFTHSFMHKNREFGIIVKDAAKVEAIKEIFEKDWNRETLTENSNPEIVLSPIDGREKIINLLNSATSTIDIWQQSVQDDEVIETLKAKIAEGVTVRIIIPSLYRASGNSTAVGELGTNSIRSLLNPYIHAKLVIIDKKSTYIGSNNFTATSLDQNRELGVITDDPEILNTLNMLFEIEWKQTIDPYDS